MKTQQHTPGPWRYAGHGGTHCLDAAGRCIAEAPQPNGMPESEGIANAHLIASAPDLLAALEALLDWGREHTSPTQPNSPHNLLVAACAAIAKAKGNP